MGRTQDVVESLATQTLVGVKYFCFACSSQAAYFLFTATLDYYGYHIGFFTRKDTKEMCKAFFLGMGSISSFAAIHSIVLMERSFGHKYLRGFNAERKFWSAKVLVSLAFLQSLAMVLPPFSLLSETRQKLLYASTLCFECFLISVFHLVAWSSKETWFSESESFNESFIEFDEFETDDYISMNT